MNLNDFQRRIDPTLTDRRRVLEEEPDELGALPSDGGVGVGDEGEALDDDLAQEVVDPAAVLHPVLQAKR